MRKFRGYLFGLVTGALLAGLVGVAVAAIPDPGGVIHACSQNVSGANKPVKLLDTAQATTCPSGWTPVTWNQQGAPGTPGAPGTDGTTIVSRVRLQQPTVPSLDASNPTTVPLVGASWTQPGNAVDQVIPGTFVYVGGGGCQYQDVSTGLWHHTTGIPIHFVVSLDGSVIQGIDTTYNFSDDGISHEMPVAFPDQRLFEPGVATPHVITVTFGKPGTQPYRCNKLPTLTAFSVDVTEMR